MKPFLTSLEADLIHRLVEHGWEETTVRDQAEEVLDLAKKMRGIPVFRPFLRD